MTKRSVYFATAQLACVQLHQSDGRQQVRRQSREDACQVSVAFNELRYLKASSLIAKSTTCLHASNFIGDYYLRDDHGKRAQGH